MAVATPVLERNEVTEERKINYAYENKISEAEEHNARIRKNYEMLINPETRIDELLGRRRQAVAEQASAEQQVAAAATVAVEEQPVSQASARSILFAQKPYLVENARADAEIFRADSPVNRKVVAEAPQAAVEDAEEENEDLMPTLTTIQYKSSSAQQTIEEGKITNRNAEKRVSLSKKEKIAIAVVVGVIVALFALIIINSAVISNLNNDLNSLQSSLTTVKAAYAGVSNEINTVASSVVNSVEQFAIMNGMVKYVI